MSLVTRYILAAFVPLLVLLAALAPAAARSTIQLENGTSLSFAEGSVDMASGSGELLDVALLEGDEILLRADYLRIDASGSFGGSDWFVHELVAENAELPEEQTFVGKIELRDIAFGMLTGDEPPANVEDLVTEDSLVRVANVGFSSPEAIVSVDLMETLPFAFDMMANGELVMTSAGFDVRGVTVMAQDGSGEENPFFAALEERGITDLGMDLRFETLAEVGTSDLTIYYGIETAIGDLSAIGLGFAFSISQDAYQNLVPLLSDTEDNAAALLGLSGTVVLEGAELVIEDAGAIDIMLAIAAEEEGVGEDEMRFMTRMMLGTSLQQIFPGTAARLMPPIEAMINSGGRLTIDAQPPTPVPLSSAIGFVMLPDMAIDQLGITVTHTP